MNWPEAEPGVDLADRGARGLEVRRDLGREVLRALLHVRERFAGCSGLFGDDVETGVDLLEGSNRCRSDRDERRGHVS